MVPQVLELAQVVLHLVSWNPEISAGHLVEVGAVVAGVALVAGAMRADNSHFKSALSYLTTKVDKMAEAIVTLARQDERLKNLEREVYKDKD